MNRYEAFFGLSLATALVLDACGPAQATATDKLSTGDGGGQSAETVGVNIIETETPTTTEPTPSPTLEPTATTIPTPTPKMPKVADRGPKKIDDVYVPGAAPGTTGAYDGGFRDNEVTGDPLINGYYQWPLGTNNFYPVGQVADNE